MYRRPISFAILLAATLTWTVPATPVCAQVREGDTAPAAEHCAAAKVAKFARAASRSAASVASANFDATYYRLDLDLDFTAPMITGVVRAEGTVVGSALTALVLDFDSGMSVDSVTTAAGAALMFTHVSDALSIGFPVAPLPGTKVAVDVYYHGLPTPGSDVFEFGERSGATYAWSYSEPYDARRWWPCKDHPADKADSVTVIVTVPDTITVGSQGVLRSMTSNGARTRYEWHSNYPIATYLVSVAAGEYVRYDETYTRPSALVTLYGALDLPIVHYVYDDGSNSLPAGWQNTIAAMEVMESWFGPYPFPTEKYGHAEVTFGGGMEHQTLTSMGSRSTNIVAHELAHQWFGDMVSPRAWKDLWLNEGFATYAELLYSEARDPGNYPLFVRNTIQNSTYAEGTLVLEDTMSVTDMFNPTRVYAKGGIVLHMLRSVVGESAFRDILLQYAGNPGFAYGTATTADFIALAESVSGQDLDTFFRQWVTVGTGYPRYQVEAIPLTQGDYKVFVTVRQTQTPAESNVDVFVMPVTIAVMTDAGEERFTVMNDARHQTYELDVSGRPDAVVFDPDFAILRDINLETTPSNVSRTPAFRDIYPNPSSSSSLLSFTLPDDRAADIELFDAAGRRVRVVDRVTGAGLHEMTIDLGTLTSGVYFIRLDGAAGTDQRKLVVVR